MLLYQLHDMQNAALAPLRIMAEATQATFQNPMVPASYTEVGRALAASAEIFELSTRPYNKPAFNITDVKLRGQTLTIDEKIVASKPFCQLIHFCRSTSVPDLARGIENDPRVLIIAPLAGNFSTLLRGTVEAMLPEHDVYITDWTDAKMAPLTWGQFDLEDNITYIMEFIRLLGADTHVLAVCQPSVPALCAAALMAEDNDPATPRSITLMGGPIDTRTARTQLTNFTQEHSLEWFDSTVIQTIPFYYPGAYRRVYPGYLQIQGYVSMHLGRHIGEQFKMFQHLVRGDEEAAAKTRHFYDEYLSTMDVTAEFYLQTIERIFQTFDLPRGKFLWKNRIVKPDAIRNTAMLTVEGEMDDISAPGQTRAALNLCPNLASNMKKSHLEIGVGHFGVFNGRRWRNNIQPIVRNFIRANSRNA